MARVHSFPAGIVSPVVGLRSGQITKSENGTTDFYRTSESSVRRPCPGVAAGVAHSSKKSGDSDLELLRDGTAGGAAADDIFYCRAYTAFGGASGRTAAHNG